MRDLREVADLPELLHDVLTRVHNGVPTVRTAVLVDDRMELGQNVSPAEVNAWLQGFLVDPEKLACDPDDKLFRVRIAAPRPWRDPSRLAAGRAAA